ncbi:MAG: terpene cyclase/mutase family protein [Bradymonadales bacterium]|nr:terpene cyclase/mutase family protein [Bradymonadales bacterium]
MSRSYLGWTLTISAFLVIFGSFIAIAQWARYPRPFRWGEQAGEVALDYLRCRLEGDGCRLEEPARCWSEPGERILFATWYLAGSRGRTVVATGRSGGEALERLAQALVREIDVLHVDLDTARLRLDLLTTRGPVLSGIPLLFGLSIVPGLDGLGMRVDDRTAYLMPYELQEEGLLVSHRPFAFMDLRFGLDAHQVVGRLEEMIGGSPGPRKLFRFRTESYIEASAGQVVSLYRNAPPVPPAGRREVEKAIRAAADWIVSAQRGDGSFHYRYEPLLDRYAEGEYSLTRHAGTVLFLLQALEHTGDRRYRLTADQALEYLWDHTTQDCGRAGAACVGGPPAVGIGTSALALAALVEHHRSGGSRSLQRARKLGEFLLMMQKPDGNFWHRYPFDGPLDPKVHTFYQTGEAAFALALLAQADPQETAWREAVRRTLEYWVDDYWDHLAGGFFFAEEHWTCLAIEAAHPLFESGRYDRFCLDIARFLARLVHDQTSSPFPDFVGGAGFGALFPPHTTPTATRMEAMVAAYRISVMNGQPDQDLADAIRRSARFLLAAQYRDGHRPLLPNPARALGGFRESALVPTIRIDYNQHAGSALLRALTAEGLVVDLPMPTLR